MTRITSTILDNAAKRASSKLRDDLHVKIDRKVAGRNEVAIYDSHGYCNTLHIFTTNRSALDYLSGLTDALSIVGR